MHCNIIEGISLMHTLDSSSGTQFFFLSSPSYCSIFDLFSDWVCCAHTLLFVHLPQTRKKTNSICALRYIVYMHIYPSHTYENETFWNAIWRNKFHKSKTLIMFKVQYTEPTKGKKHFSHQFIIFVYSSYELKRFIFYLTHSYIYISI